LGVFLHGAFVFGRFFIGRFSIGIFVPTPEKLLNFETLSKKFSLGAFFKDSETKIKRN